MKWKDEERQRGVIAAAIEEMVFASHGDRLALWQEVVKRNDEEGWRMPWGEVVRLSPIDLRRAFAQANVWLDGDDG